jgi:hypothetical protein
MGHTQGKAWFKHIDTRKYVTNPEDKPDERLADGSMLSEWAAP